MKLLGCNQSLLTHMLDTPSSAEEIEFVRAPSTHAFLCICLSKNVIVAYFTYMQNSALVHRGLPQLESSELCIFCCQRVASEKQVGA